MSSNNVESVPVDGLDNPQKLVDRGQLSTVIQVPRSRHGIEKDLQNFAMVNGVSESYHAHPAGGSRDGSPSSSVGHIYNEKLRDRSSRPITYRQSTARSQGRGPSTRDEQLSMHNGHNRASVISPSKPSTPQKRKKSGLGMVIRKIFGRRSVKNRISLPAPTENPFHESKTFITSPVIEKQRAASAPSAAPSAGVLRSSALGSHAPFIVDIPRDYRSTVSGLPPQPERPPPERPTRPRRASLPSVILSSQEAEDINNALTGLGLQDTGTQIVEGHNIGFAVTSGSNPKRRSRSVGAYRSSGKEHRMSPIQWRQWRRRSDEIRYWRESKTSDGSPAIGGTGFVTSEPLGEISADPNPKPSFIAVDGEGRPFEAHNQDFNFGLPPDDVQSNENIGEHIGLEERMITLELKLMDFEFAISKLQAGSFSPADRFQHPEPLTVAPAVPAHSRSVSDQPQMHSSKVGSSAFIDQYPSLAYYQNSGTPASQQGPFAPGHDSTIIHPKPRPISIATTLKASGASNQNNSPITRDRSARNSITELTIEHYTTLITLIRREQSARMRLEDQVTELQRQVELLQARSPSASHSQQRREQQQNLGRHFSPDDIRRPYRLGVEGREQRGRSSNYSDEETDTDDDAFHDVYVTPVERGEFERESFEGEEGVAF